MYTGVGNQTVMQTMEMGPSEAALTQMSAIPSASSSSYFLQLDPSGHVDILESSLVLSKPDMADETVYEIQLDPYVMDERNVEIINLQNIPNTVTFQPEFLEEHQFTGSFDTQVHYQVDGLNFNQILMNTTTEIPAQPTATETCSESSWEGAAVPEYTVETEIGTETEQGATSSSVYSAILPGLPVQDQMLPQIQSLEYAPVVQGEMDATYKTALETAFNMNFTPGGSEPLVSHSFIEETAKVEVSNDQETQNAENSEANNAVIESKATTDTDSETASQAIEKIVKEEPPDSIMEFTEEAVIPPVVEIFPTPKKTDEEIMSPPIITVYDNEDDEGESSDEEPPSLVSKFLYDGIDPDDELYISYLRRPDATKRAMCILCYEWFHGIPELDEHVKSVHENNMKLYGCKRCGQQFWARFLRQRHEKLHRYDIKGPIQRYFPKNRPFDHYESRHFVKRFRPAPYTEKYRDHLRVIHSQIKSSEFDCIQCDQSFQLEEELREHYEEMHALQTCILCRKHVEGSNALRMHEQELHGLYNVNKNYPGGAWKLWDNWECEEMTEKDDRLVNLFVYHNYTKRIKNENSSGEETPSNNCDNFAEFGCEEVTVSELEGTTTSKPAEVKSKPVEKERRRSSASKQKANQTAKFGEISKGRKTDPKPAPVKFQDYDKIEFIDDEQKPETLVKRNDLPFKCDTCKTSFDNDTDLQRHMKSHSIRTMAYMCQYCGRGFATHSNRKEHERIHTGDKPYVCPICSRAFVQISNLKKHIQTHKDKNNLQCSTCNKQFVKESSLILHQRAHSQDRKFRCHICDRAYNYASLLKRHMRIHTGENPYSCEDCGMQFHELVSLHYHRKKVHTGERPHRCEQCGRAFILSSDLKKHLKIHLRDGNSIKSSGTSANAKSKSGLSKVIVISESPNANTNGAITEPMVATPLMENNVESPMEEDEEDEYTNSSSLIEFQADESVEMRDQTGTDRILVISETDLLNVTGNEAKVDGIINPDSADTSTNHENDFSHQNSTEAVP